MIFLVSVDSMKCEFKQPRAYALLALCVKC